jgi:hypothetical protein
LNDERETVVFTVGREVAEAAISQIASCESCTPEAAEIPFEVILDCVMLFSGVHTDYFMPEPPVCPQCKATVTEKTFVEWDGGIVVDVTA